MILVQILSQDLLIATTPGASCGRCCPQGSRVCDGGQGGGSPPGVILGSNLLDEEGKGGEGHRYGQQVGWGALQAGRRPQPWAASRLGDPSKLLD